MKSPPSFQFYPRDLVADPAVRLMSPEARGGYLMLLCQAWMAHEPGVLEDDDAILAGLSELGPDRWAACKESIRRAFHQTSREGRKVLVQRRMVSERQAQIDFRAVAILGGAARMAKMTPEHRSAFARQAANARWHKGESQPDASHMPADASTASASASAVSQQKIQKKKHARARRASPVLTISEEQREAAAKQYSLDRALIDSLASRVEAEAAAGKYVSAPGALHTFCRNEVRWAQERARVAEPNGSSAATVQRDDGWWVRLDNECDEIADHEGRESLRMQTLARSYLRKHPKAEISEIIAAIKLYAEVNHG